MLKKLLKMLKKPLEMLKKLVLLNLAPFAAVYAVVIGAKVNISRWHLLGEDYDPIYYTVQD